MAGFKELSPTAEPAPTPAGIEDRRRPERKDQVSSHLIPLLRSPAKVEVSAPLPDELDMPRLADNVAHLESIPLSFGVFLLLGVPFWTWTALVAWVVLRLTRPGR